MTVERWNSLYPIGTPVIAYPGFRPEHPAADSLGCTRLETVTRSRAWPLGHGTPVVLVDGYSGGIDLDHIDVLPRDPA